MIFMTKKIKLLFIFSIAILSYFVYSSTEGYDLVVVKPPSPAHVISEDYHTITYYNSKNNGVIMTFAVDSKTDNKIGHIYWGYIYADDVKTALGDERTNEDIIKDMEKEQKYLKQQLGDKYSDGSTTAETIGKESYWVMAYYDMDTEEPYVTYEINFWAEDFDISDKGMQNVIEYFKLDKIYDESSEYFTMKKFKKYGDKLKFKDIVKYATEHYSLDMSGNVLDITETEGDTDE